MFTLFWVHYKNHTDIFSQGNLMVLNVLDIMELLEVDDDVEFDEIYDGTYEDCYNVRKAIRHHDR